MEERRRALLADLTEARAFLLETVTKLSEPDLQRTTANPNWTVKDVLCHLASAAPGNQARIKAILGGQPGLPPEFDLNRWNERQVERRQEASLPQLLEELAQARQETTRLVATLTPEELGTQGRHASGAEVTVEEILRIMARHERGHAAEIRQALQR